MRAVAIAFVLIVVAAVVLWYGNTLNSWVLGGLIGGLAALLLSIPISLALFAYLSRRHDARHASYEEEEVYDDEMYPGQVVESVSLRRTASLSARAAREEWEDEEELEDYYEEPEQPSRSYVSTKENSRLPSKYSTRKMLYSAGHSQHQADALRAARKEAAQQFEDLEDQQRLVRRPQPTQSPLTRRTSRNLNRPPTQPEPSENLFPRQSRRRSEEQQPQTQWRDTDFLQDQFLVTGPMNLPPRQNVEPEFETGNLQRPMVRRAPYIYEDDPQHEQLEHYRTEPITRRSSRLDKLRNQHPGKNGS